MHSRDDSFSIKISDPDLIDNSPNTKLINLNDKRLILFKENSTYYILTADGIDPERQHLDTGNTYEKISAYGSSSQLFARIFLQSQEILDLTFWDNPNKESILAKIWETNLLLANCVNYRDEITKQIDDVATRCDALIEQHKHGKSIPALPQISNLDLNTKAFLSTGKLFITQCFKLISMFVPLPIKSANETHFNTHIKWLETNAPELSSLTTALKSDLGWIRTLSECRNAIEHSRPGLSIKLNNFKLLPGNKFTLPTWCYDLTDRIPIKRECAIIDEMDTYINNMLFMLEEILLHCISIKLLVDNKFQIYQIDENAINPKCPIAYRAFFSKTSYP